jgi:hypothetical protein
MEKIQTTYLTAQGMVTPRTMPQTQPPEERPTKGRQIQTTPTVRRSKTLPAVSSSSVTLALLWLQRWNRFLVAPAACEQPQ